MTTFNVEVAMQQLEKRKKSNAGKPRVNNSSLHAGSPMYYYCRGCGEEMTMPELHYGPAPRYCYPCEILHDHGLV